MGIDRDIVIAQIDDNLSYLHSQRWAREAVGLREAVRQADAAEKPKAEAEAALRDHYANMHNPQSSRDAIIEQILNNR